MKTFTRQETFDIVVVHLRQQGCRGGPADDCLYRFTNKDGRILKCAAGCLIPDDKYTPEWEGFNIFGLRADFAIPEVKGSLFFGHDYNLVCALQEIHDCVEVGEWEGRFGIAARNHNLKLIPLEGK